MNEREQAMAEYEAGIRATGTNVPNAFLAGFTRGWDVRDAEVDGLRAIINRAHRESIAGDGRSSVVLAVVRDILAEGVAE